MTAKKKGVGAISLDLQKQREFTRGLPGDFEFSLIVADAFVRGIRDIGYKSTGTAIDELIDNAIQAEATEIHVVFIYDSNSSKPVALAVIDDGHGMDPGMIRLAAMWGGTHREGDRVGFGRYGYGLPSASLSQGQSFTIYSCPPDGEWHELTLDVEAISKGELTASDGRILLPEATPSELPEWIEGYITESLSEGELESGTVIVLDKLDRLTYKTEARLERLLLEHFGITYRNFLRQLKLVVNGKVVQPLDPLFLTPGARFYDLDEDRAEALPSLNIEVKDDGGTPHLVKVRFSHMPPTFQRLDKAKETGRRNARFQVMKDHNGIIVLRNGRQIDVITSKCPWTTFVNYDRNWGVEIDFPAGLDEEFSITTSKQQVVLSERMWNVLKEKGVWAAIQQMRAKLMEERAKLKEAVDAGEAGDNGQRASELAMAEIEKFKTRKPAADPDQAAKAAERLHKEAERRAEETGRPVDEVEKELEAEFAENPYDVQAERLPGAPFFRVEQIGGRRVLYLNTAHRFYTDVYAGPQSTPRTRAQVEVLLFVIGGCEIDASGERRLFYETERNEWSKDLTVALDRLGDIDSIDEELASQQDPEDEGAEETTPAS